MDEFDDDWNLNPAHILINMEDFQFVWLDPLIKTSKSPLNVRYYRDMIIKLNTAVQFFTDLYKCINFIKTIKKEKIFLIVSGSTADDILKKIHLYKPLTAIFIFTRHEDHYENLLDKYKKIIGIYQNRDRLIESIRQTMEKTKNPLSSPIFFGGIYQKSFRELSNEQATFFWHQLLLIVLKDFPYDENEKIKFLKTCTKHYRRNPEQMMYIEQFREGYQSNRAIEWYTKQTFLYKVVNKALRDDNIYLISLFRFFIIDLYNDLIHEKENMADNENIITVYRGMTISQTQVNDYIASAGKLISIKGFISTSHNKAMALSFTKTSNPTNEKGILFEIKIDPKKKDVLFANISHRSDFAGEQEILFGPNTVFRIDLVEFYTTEEHLTVKMTATDEFSKHFYTYLSLQQEDMNNYTPSIHFGRILFTKMGEIEQAKLYFDILREKYSINHDNVPLIYLQMGDIQLLEENYGEALAYYNKAMRIYYDQSKPKKLRIIDCLLKIGNLYLEQGKTDETKRFGERALRLLNKVSKAQPSRKGMILQMMGKAYLDHGKTRREKGYVYPSIMELDKADKYLEEAYNLFDALQLLERKNYISIIGDMSDWYEAKDDHIRARELVKKQVDLAQIYLSFDDPNQQIYLEHYLHLYEKHGLQNLALKFVRKRLKFYKKKYGKTHPMIIKILLAMKCYITVCHILFDIEPLDEHTIVYCLNKLSQNKDTNIANIKLYEKWIWYLIENYPTYERRIGDAFRQLANIYNDLNQPNEAFFYLSYSLQIYRCHEDHLNMRTVEDFMRHIEQVSGRLHLANIVCDDNWQDGILFLGQKFNQTPILHAPSSS